MLKDDALLEPLKLGARVVGYFKNGTFVKTGQDHLNSVVLNENENVSLNTPYGEREERSESSEMLDFTLKGYDQEIGAVRMGHRYYDSVTGKFLTPDPLFLENAEKCVESPVECSLYGYAGNDPLRFVDPSGKGALDFDNSSQMSYRQNAYTEGRNDPAIQNNLASFDKYSAYGAAAGGITVGALAATGGAIAAGPIVSSVYATTVTTIENASLQVASSMVVGQTMISKASDKAQYLSVAIPEIQYTTSKVYDFLSGYTNISAPGVPGTQTEVVGAMTGQIVDNYNQGKYDSLLKNDK